MNPTLAIVILATGARSALGDPAPAKSQYDSAVKPILTHYCYTCHGEKKRGGLDLRVFTNEAAARANQKEFSKVLEYLQSGEMPPEEEAQPSKRQRETVENWIAATVLGCDCDHPDPGRVTIRRLNRVEYNNTIRDLTGVDFHPADDFPADNVGYGFDNIGDVLSLPPVLMERYLSAAERILKQAIPDGSATNGSVSRRLIFIRVPGSGPTNEVARAIITNIARRAFRRPVKVEETDRLMQLFQMAESGGENFDTGIKLALEAVLVSPDFLFRGEFQSQPDDPKSAAVVDDYALASRLSYFLWSSMPDEELFALASQNKLHQKLHAEVARMLKDPKARSLAGNFAEQWLAIRNLATVTPDRQLFPEFDDDLRADMAKETELCFQRILSEDRSVLEFIDADYTYLNERLAKLYGINGVTGNDFRLVKLPDHRRGGLLTEASILTITSNPTRTSPVKRGKWVLENILGTPPPPPLPDVPPLKEGKEAALSGTLRQRMEQHRADPACANCHAKMDPIGFGFENFDAVGAWRTNEGTFPIDASGELGVGRNFNGAAQLKAILLKDRKDQFVRCLAEKLMTYALGRGLENYDKCAIDKIVGDVEKNRYKFSRIILGVVDSVPFQQRRGEQDAAASGSL